MHLTRLQPPRSDLLVAGWYQDIQHGLPGERYDRLIDVIPFFDSTSNVLKTDVFLDQSLVKHDLFKIKMSSMTSLK